MKKRTGPITFNAADRGWLHGTGSDRNFDLQSLCNIINSPRVQELVASRSMAGFFGHGWRARYGLWPPESVVLEGKEVPIQVAFVTVSLKAEPNGTITHEAEFLDTPNGNLAWRTFQSRMGGFSSAINAVPMPDGTNFVRDFAGFDYVYTPNYNDNRGWMFDCAQAPDTNALLLDRAVQEQQYHALMSSMIDAKERDLALAMQTIASLEEERAELLSISAGQSSGAILDSGRPTAILTTDTHASSRFAKTIGEFGTAPLAGYQSTERAAHSDRGDALLRAGRVWQ